MATERDLGTQMVLALDELADWLVGVVVPGRAGATHPLRYRLDGDQSFRRRAREPRIPVMMRESTRLGVPVEAEGLVLCEAKRQRPERRGAYSGS